jgi:plastocyanin
MPSTSHHLMLLVPALALAVAASRPVPQIVQRNKAFSQAEIRVSAGDSIAFVNSDDVSHNVFSASDGMKFNLKRQAPRSSVAIAFPKKGMAEVRCAFHPGMKLKVVVE